MSYDLIFVFDANHRVGAGHMMRAMALMQRLGAESLSMAACGQIDSKYQAHIKSMGVECYGKAKGLKAECIVIDKYGNPPYLKERWVGAKKQILFEDLPNRASKEIDLVISPFSDEEVLSRRYPNARRMVGIEHLLFRQELESIKDSENTPAEQRIVVSLGGSEQTVTLRRCINALRVHWPDVEIEVFGNTVGLCDESNVTLRGFHEDFLKRAKSASYVISAAGQSLLELVYIGAPVIGVPLADNQMACSNTLKGLGVPIADLGLALAPQLTTLSEATQSVGVSKVGAQGESIIDAILGFLA